MRTVPIDETARPITLPPGAVCVLTLDATHRITHANAEFERATGRAGGTWNGLALDRCCHPDMPLEVLRDIWATVDDGAAWVAPLKWLRADGLGLWMRTTFAPMHRVDERRGSMVVGTGIAAGQAFAAEQMYHAIAKRGLAWRDAASRNALLLNTASEP